MIRINRNTEYRDKVRSYKFIVDDMHIGDIKNGEQLEYEIPEGHHTIYLSIDWCRSNKIDFHVAPNEVTEFNCGNSMKGWRVFLGVFYVTFLKNRYLWLEKVFKGKRYDEI